MSQMIKLMKRTLNQVLEQEFISEHFKQRIENQTSSPADLAFKISF